jgi:hypothetical protein
VFLYFGNQEGIKGGDVFFLSRRSRLLKHPLNQKDLGYLLTPRSKVLIKERARHNIFRAEIVEHYADSSIHDLIFPFVPAASCLKPLPVEKEVRGLIAAVEREQDNAGKFSIVYLDCGTDKGLKPGHLLEIVKIRNVWDPAIPPPMLENAIIELFKVKTFPEVLEKLTRESVLYELGAGSMLVLEAGPDTATTLVIASKEPVPKGSFFRGIPRTELPGFLSSLAACEVN